MCGGIGKNELSMKAMKPNTHNEYWLPENDKVQLYNRLSINNPILKLLKIRENTSGQVFYTLNYIIYIKFR
jgi:hypothetical protein